MAVRRVFLGWAGAAFRFFVDLGLVVDLEDFLEVEASGSDSDSDSGGGGKETDSSESSDSETSIGSSSSRAGSSSLASVAVFRYSKFVLQRTT